MPASNSPGASNPPFSTPNPDELQSQESQSAVRERLSAQQGGETSVDNKPADHLGADSPDGNPVLDNNADDDRTLENRLDETGLGLSSPPPPD